MTDSIAFKVAGEPIPQGSKVRNRYGGVREDNPRTRPWRSQVEWEAALAMRARGLAMIEGPVEVSIHFVFKRPASHYGTGRNSEVVKPNAPKHHESKPDVDKLSRAILDSLSGTVIKDDCKVVRLHADKSYGDPCAIVTVRSL